MEVFENVKNIKVVNALAEIAVQLTQDYINMLAKYENQSSILPQFIKEYSNKFPSATKECLTKTRKFHDYTILAS